MRAGPIAAAAPARSGEERTRLIELRAERALAHFAGLARGATARLCPICGHRGAFSPVRHKPEIWCPGCDSRPRHRLLALWIARALRLKPGAEVLHFAAEPGFRALLEAQGARYRAADLNDRYDLRLDIAAIDLPDAALDLVIACHVLEHVEDDRAALAELFRVLRPGGRAALMVPLVEGWDATYEPEGLDAAARALRLGDADHRRFYGRDFRDRIRAAGFALEEFAAVEPDVSTHALHRGERVFVGVKP